MLHAEKSYRECNWGKICISTGFRKQFDVVNESVERGRDCTPWFGAVAHSLNPILGLKVM
jgi:hypothetical protein